MMKNKKLIRLSKTVIAGFIIVLSYGCERDLTDDAIPATFPNTADIFTDAPVGLTDDFFKSFDPAGGANTEGFGTDDQVAFEGSTSIRIDVPAPNDPNGGFIGGIFKDRGEGRDLSGYDALTFWAKGSTTATIGEVGFGTDFEESNFATVAQNIQLSTDWRKYTIPIPDPSFLTQEKGMFLFSAGTQGTNGFGFTIWIDELRFENLGTLGQPRPQILNGQDIVQEGFVGSSVLIEDFRYVTNLANGLNQSVNCTVNYFTFNSSNPSVATVSDLGVVTILSPGTSIITGRLDGIVAEGSLEITSSGPFPNAPIPNRDAANVISLFSDVYNNIPVRHYNGFFGPPPNGFQTTTGGAGSDPNNVDIQAQLADGTLDNIINYQMLNFVSIGTYETVPLTDVSAMTHLHVDINLRESLNSGDFIRISLESGTGTGSTTSGNFTINTAALGNVDANGWVSVDIPLSSFAGFSDLNNLGQIFFISDNTISDIWVDNVYFYNE